MKIILGSDLAVRGPTGPCARPSDAAFLAADEGSQHRPVDGVFPCGQLYGVIAISFAVGGLPALLALQWQTGCFQRLGAEPSAGPSTPSCY